MDAMLGLEDAIHFPALVGTFHPFRDSAATAVSCCWSRTAMAQAYLLVLPGAFADGPAGTRSLG